MEEELVLLKFNNKELDDLNPLICKGDVTKPKDTHKCFKRRLSLKYQYVATKNHKNSLFCLKYVLTDDDIFFHYRCEFDPQSFKTLHTQQQLSVTFDNFPLMISKLIFQMSKGQTKLYLTVMPDQYILFSFYKTINFKQINVVSLTAVKPPPKISNELIAYRYNYLSAEIQRMSGRLMDVRDKLKVNPQLLLQFNKMCSES